MSAQRKAPASLEAQIAAHRAELLAFVRSRTKPSWQAEDLVQQIVAKALTRVDQLRDPSAVRAWLFRIARHVIADDRRRARPVEVEAREELLPVNEAAPEGDSCQCVLAQAEALKPEYAMLLTKVVLDGESVTEVAKQLGITPNNATVRLHRARTALKDRLKKHCGTETLAQCLDCSCSEDGLTACAPSG